MIGISIKQSDVWKLETPEDDFYCDLMKSLYSSAISGDKAARKFIQECFKEDWKTIKEKMKVEESKMYAWYMNGVSELSSRCAY